MRASELIAILQELAVQSATDPVVLLPDGCDPAPELTANNTVFLGPEEDSPEEWL